MPELVRLANNSHEAVRKLAQDLLGERDPRKDVGLAAWGELLESNTATSSQRRSSRSTSGRRN